MAETTLISWADATFNPWLGCTKISPGCDHCYAEVSTPSRTMKVLWGPQEARRRTSAGNWSLPLRWNNSHTQFFEQNNHRQRVFCASLSDVFDNQVDSQWREDLWQLVRATPNLDWLILTKRIGNVIDMLPVDWGEGYANVWLGISIVNQNEADRDIPKLLNVPAQIRWLSMEPLLGPVTFKRSIANPSDEFCTTDTLKMLDWIVVGGESGPKARKMLPIWVSNLRDECAAASVPFFFKQWGGSEKDKGGCLLSGVELKNWPLPKSQ